MVIIFAVLAGFVLAVIAPWLHRVARGATGWLLALLPAGLAVYFASLLGSVADGEAITISRPWATGLGINLSFYIDGLSLLFAHDHRHQRSSSSMPAATWPANRSLPASTRWC